MTEYEIENLKTLCRLTKPEAWQFQPNGSSLSGIVSEYHPDSNGMFARATETEAQAIVAFGNAMPKLIDEIERLRSSKS